jgi:hypothetical protein
MTDKRFKEVVHSVLQAVAEKHGLSLESDLKGGERGYAQELTGRAILRMIPEIVQHTTDRPVVISEGREI